jgi:hypothetical protein
VLRHVSHFTHVPFRTSAKVPYLLNISASYSFTSSGFQLSRGRGVGAASSKIARRNFSSGGRAPRSSSPSRRRRGRGGRSGRMKVIAVSCREHGIGANDNPTIALLFSRPILLLSSSR